MNNAMPKLSPAQQRTLDLLKQHGTIVNDHNGNHTPGGVKVAGFSTVAAHTLAQRGLVAQTVDDYRYTQRTTRRMVGGEVTTWRHTFTLAD